MHKTAKHRRVNRAVPYAVASNVVDPPDPILENGHSFRDDVLPTPPSFLGGVAPAPIPYMAPLPPLPPTVVPDGLPTGLGDYTQLLLTTGDSSIPRRELGWAIDEMEHRHPRFDRRLLGVLRRMAASTRTDPEQFILWHYLIIGCAIDLPLMQERLKRHTPYHLIDPALQLWKHEFRVFALAKHSESKAACDGFPRRYVDMMHFVSEMRDQYLKHFDHLGQWTDQLALHVQARVALPLPLAAPHHRRGATVL